MTYLTSSDINIAARSLQLIQHQQNYSEILDQNVYTAKSHKRYVEREVGAIITSKRQRCS